MRTSTASCSCCCQEFTSAFGNQPSASCAGTSCEDDGVITVPWTYWVQSRINLAKMFFMFFFVFLCCSYFFFFSFFFFFSLFIIIFPLFFFFFCFFFFLFFLFFKRRRGNSRVKVRESFQSFKTYKISKLLKLLKLARTFTLEFLPSS